MSDFNLIILILGLFAVILIITMMRENAKQKRHFISRLREQWGQIPKREYSWKELDNISHYSMRHSKEGFYVDDITWNDLDMDRIYMLMNQSVSAPGDEYLYHLLRNPEFDLNTLKERDRLAEYFRTHQGEREKIQIALSDAVKNPNLSLSDSLYVLEDINIGSNLKHILMASAAVLSIIFFFLKPSAGIFVFLAVMLINMGMYLKDKEKIEPYLMCFRNVLNLLTVSGKIVKLNLPEIKDYTQQIVKSCEDLEKFRKGAFLVVIKPGLASGPEYILLEYIRMFFHADLIKFNDMLKEVLKNKDAIEHLITGLGALDSSVSIASFREAMPFYSIPQFGNGNKEGSAASLWVKDLYHPLIQNPVANSIRVAGGTLVTGSNASGKSTFLKNVAINTILAQSVYTCVASSYQAPFLKVMTSMALRDDLQGGESYYIVEIKSLNRILEEAKSEIPLLCVIDEVLRGTNTIERIAASSRILEALNQCNILPFAATHDIELTYILEGVYKNYHFEEEVRDKDVVFNYLLHPGRATTRNAIKLLDMIGYDKKIVSSAQRAAQDFEEKGVWTPVRKKERLC